MFSGTWGCELTRLWAAAWWTKPEEQETRLAAPPVYRARAHIATRNDFVYDVGFAMFIKKVDANIFLK